MEEEEEEEEGKGHLVAQHDRLGNFSTKVVSCRQREEVVCEGPPGSAGYFG